MCKNEMQRVNYMYNIQIVLAHNKQKPLTKITQKKHGQSKQGTKVTNKEAFGKKKSLSNLA
jgi:hypothetical protein